MKNVAVIGIGRLGLCFSLTLEKGGYRVIGCDVNEEYVQSLKDGTFVSYEPNVNNTLEKSKNFTPTTDLKRTVDESEILFVTVRTESEPDGKYDHSQVETLIKQLQELGVQDKIKSLVICSNINPGYCDEIATRLEGFNFKVSFNPECIAQGTILYNQSHPDIVIIATPDTNEADKIEEIYDNITMNIPKIHRFDKRVSGELFKLSMNCFLTMKISFANMVGDIATEFGGEVDKILNAVGGDSRIGNKYLKYGYGYGGPCFPRDNRALIHSANKVGITAELNIASDKINKQHLEYQIEKFKQKHKVGSDVTIDTVTYKEGVVILEESQQLLYALRLAEIGYNVTIREHEVVIKELKKLYGDIFKYQEKE